MDALSAWRADWAWSLPLIAMSVVIHVFCLGLLTARVEGLLMMLRDRHRFRTTFAMMVMSVAVTVATILHGFEATIWAAAYRLLDAIPDDRSAVLYSLGAMTSYGHADLYLRAEWQLMGAFEALNGMLLFGLTTAFLFAMIQRVWPVGSRGRRRSRSRQPVPAGRDAVLQTSRFLPDYSISEH
jgi:hypothetical protein